MENNLSQTIVLVDDETELLDVYKMRLKSLSTQFVTFNKPQEFVAYLQANPDFTPDLLITDFNMPGMTGVQMVEAALKLRKFFPSILLSGFIDKEKAISANNTGVSHIIEKPADKDQMLSLAKKLLLESRIRNLGKEIRVVMTQLTEMFVAFRLLCVDELELEAMTRPIVMASPEDPSSKAMSLDDTLSALEKKLQYLAQEEEKISEALSPAKTAA